MQDILGNDATRASLKTALLQQIVTLGQQRSLLPSSPVEPIDAMAQQLETLNPIPDPLNPRYFSTLLGSWQLIYASRGTVVTRTLRSIPNFSDSIKIKRVWQSLVADRNEQIFANNYADLNLPLLGEWRIQADGIWKPDKDYRVANVSFDAFSVQATQLFGLANWSFPQLKIPVLEFLRHEAVWMTSYLDEEIRIGRGITGNLFVFRRE